MGAVPLIQQTEPLPSLIGLAMVGFEIWRVRRISAGLSRANKRGDVEAAQRWIMRGERAVADLDKARDRMRPRRRPR